MKVKKLLFKIFGILIVVLGFVGSDFTFWSLLLKPLYNLYIGVRYGMATIQFAWNIVKIMIATPATYFIFYLCAAIGMYVYQKHRSCK